MFKQPTRSRSKWRRRQRTYSLEPRQTGEWVGFKWRWKQQGEVRGEWGSKSIPSGCVKNKARKCELLGHLEEIKFTAEGVEKYKFNKPAEHQEPERKKQTIK